MSFRIEPTSYFQRQTRKLFKKYRKIVEDLDEINQTLTKNPQAGDPIEGFNNLIWKIRMGSSDMQRGKSGGFRIIYLFRDTLSEVIYLLTIYSKTEQEDIDKQEIMDILKKVDLWDRFFEPDSDSSNES